MDDVLPLDQVVLQNVVDQAADEGDVGPRTQLGVEVGLGGGRITSYNVCYTKLLRSGRK